jgi:hypothetical protein
MNSIDLVDLLSINSVPILAGRESCAHKSVNCDLMIGNRRLLSLISAFTKSLPFSPSQTGFPVYSPHT